MPPPDEDEDELELLDEELELLELEDEDELELLLELEDELQLSTTPYWPGWSFSQVLREIQVWPSSQDQPLCATSHNGTVAPHQLHTSQSPPLDELDELLLDELEELEELLDELELLLELEELLELELELLLDEDELEELLDELLELEEELDELLDVVPLPAQPSNCKPPSWLPLNPNEVLPPSARLPFQLQQLLNVTVGVSPPDRSTFQLLDTLAGWLKSTWISQPLMEPGPSLVTVTSK